MTSIDQPDSLVVSERVPEAGPLPELECDVVMKGGITSGVVYPRALVELGRTYRLRGVGGASAGAIGAAAGAAAEYGRLSPGGGFALLEALPSQLGDGRLAALFQPQPSTKALLPILLAATGNARPGPKTSGLRRLYAVLGAVVRGYPVASALGLVPGLTLMVVGLVSRGWAGWLLALCGLVVAALGWLGFVGWRALRTLTVDVPANQFGICQGIGTSPGSPGFTDWLSMTIDDLAGLDAVDRPLRFGHLWSRTTDARTADPDVRDIDLRTMTTSLGEGRPYEMPWEARRFFYDPAVWARLFPPDVMKALATAPVARDQLAPSDSEEWTWEETQAAAHTPALRRLPDARDLPVIVATRLSLSFPLLISAVPLWTIDRAATGTRDAVTAYREARRAGRPAPAEARLTFRTLWFTDGGLTSNFPLHMFDVALPTRPTFAINLGRFGAGSGPDPDQRKNLRYARGNEPVIPELKTLPDKGIGALTAFASLAIDTARNWNDSAHLGFAGYRDRIVRVLQTREEGGLNLYMDSATIDGLADRGRAAGQVLVERFTQPQPGFAHPGDTAWDNHRWVRYRALLAVLPRFLTAWQRGRAAMADVDPASPPSYRGWTVETRTLAAGLSASLDACATQLDGAGPNAAAGLAEAPKPAGALRRQPTV